MLAVPFKKTQPVNWVDPLRQYIRQHYTELDAQEQNPSLHRLSTARSRVEGISGPDVPGCDAMLSYLQMLAAAEARFPVGPEQAVSDISFSWCDSFKPKKSIAMTSLPYERACTMFNFAALESHLGMNQDRTQVQEIKLACAHFMRAAGLFQFVKDNLAPKIHGPVTPDLSVEALEMLQYLMLAQAQACYYETAIKTKKPALTLSKVAAQASFLYEKAMNLTASPTLSSVLDKSWASHLRFQYGCFASSAQFQLSKAIHAKAEEIGDGYGEEIARLHAAEVKCVEAINSARSAKLPKTMLGTVEHLIAVIRKEKQRAINDNDAIYLQPIPSGANLEPPKRAALAKPTKPDPSITEVTLVGSKPSDVFHKLLPRHMHVAEARYQSELQSVVAKSAEEVQRRAEEVRVRLAEAGLPAAVEAGDRSGKGIPNAVWKRIVENVQGKGGVDGLYSKLNENESLALGVIGVLDDTETKLRQEEQEDDISRSKWGRDWTVIQSSQLSAHMYADIDRYRNLVKEAQKADKLVVSKLTENRELLARVQMTRSQLDKLLPDPQKLDDDPKVEKLRSELSILLVELGAKVQDCEVLQATLVTNCEGDTIVQELLEAPEGAEVVVLDEQRLKSIIKEKLKKHQKITKKISKLTDSYYPMLSKVLDKNHKYAEMRTENELSKLREAVIGEVNAAISVFEEIAHHISEGSTFWADVSSRANQLNNTAADHVFVRDMQRKEEDLRLEEKARNSQQHRGLSRELSVPSISPYAAGGAAMGQPVEQAQVVPPPYPVTGGSNGQLPYPTNGYSQPPPAYNGNMPTVVGTPVSNTPPVVMGQQVGATQPLDEKIMIMKATLGDDIPDAELKKILDGAGGDVNRAVNHYLESRANRKSKSRGFGIFR